jgi:hypothetical protein
MAYTDMKSGAVKVRDTPDNVYANLKHQIAAGKHQTWRDKMDEATKDIPKISKDDLKVLQGTFPDGVKLKADDETITALNNWLGLWIPIYHMRERYSTGTQAGPNPWAEYTFLRNDPTDFSTPNGSARLRAALRRYGLKLEVWNTETRGLHYVMAEIDDMSHTASGGCMYAEDFDAEDDEILTELIKAECIAVLWAAIGYMHHEQQRENK